MCPTSSESPPRNRSRRSPARWTAWTQVYGGPTRRCWPAAKSERVARSTERRSWNTERRCARGSTRSNLSHSAATRGSTRSNLSHRAATRGLTRSNLSHRAATRGSARSNLSHRAATRGLTRSNLSHRRCARGLTRSNLSHSVARCISAHPACAEATPTYPASPDPPTFRHPTRNLSGSLQSLMPFRLNVE